MRIAGLLLLAVVLAVGAVAYARNLSGAQGSQAPDYRMMPTHTTIHGEYLIAVRGDTLLVYSLHHLPDLALVSSARLPGSFEEARAIGSSTTGATPTAAAPATQAAAAPKPDGRKVYDSLGCSACHRLAGKGGTVGPDLTHEGSRHDAAWIEKKVTDPKATNPKSIMPAHKPPQKDLEALGHYLAGLK